MTSRKCWRNERKCRKIWRTGKRFTGLYLVLRSQNLISSSREEILEVNAKRNCVYIFQPKTDESTFYYWCSIPWSHYQGSFKFIKVVRKRKHEIWAFCDETFLSLSPSRWCRLEFGCGGGSRDPYSAISRRYINMHNQTVTTSFQIEQEFPALAIAGELMKEGRQQVCLKIEEKSFVLKVNLYIKSCDQNIVGSYPPNLVLGKEDARRPSWIFQVSFSPAFIRCLFWGVNCTKVAWGFYSKSQPASVRSKRRPYFQHLENCAYIKPLKFGMRHIWHRWNIFAFEENLSLSKSRILILVPYEFTWLAATCGDRHNADGLMGSETVLIFVKLIALIDISVASLQIVGKNSVGVSRQKMYKGAFRA